MTGIKTEVHYCVCRVFSKSFPDLCTCCLWPLVTSRRLWAIESSVNAMILKWLGHTWVSKSHQTGPLLSPKCLFFLSFLVCLYPKWWLYSPSTLQTLKHYPSPWQLQKTAAERWRCDPLLNTCQDLEKEKNSERQITWAPTWVWWMFAIAKNRDPFLLQLVIHPLSVQASKTSISHQSNS